MRGQSSELIHIRDLFTEDRGGYLEDVALLDFLVTAKLGREADAVRAAEGWKWTEAHLDFPHAHGMRRTYPHPVELSAERIFKKELSPCRMSHVGDRSEIQDARAERLHGSDLHPLLTRNYLSDLLERESSLLADSLVPRHVAASRRQLDDTRLRFEA
jgi:hypothetical protein